MMAPAYRKHAIEAFDRALEADELDGGPLVRVLYKLAEQLELAGHRAAAGEIWATVARLQEEIYGRVNVPPGGKDL
jgi:hypothetical protein